MCLCSSTDAARMLSARVLELLTGVTSFSGRVSGDKQTPNNRRDPELIKRVYQNTVRLLVLSHYK